MIFNVLTLFPEMYDNFKSASVIGRGIHEGIIGVNTINIRDFANNKHHRVDDYPYGGSPGMVMQVEPIVGALKSIEKPGKVIYLTPKGKPFHQKHAFSLAEEEALTFVCGHYEGIDQRFIDAYVDEEYSLGDFVLTGGELASMVMIDAIGRLIPGVLGKQASFEEESHSNYLLEHPHYTRPPEVEGMKVPDVLMSGHHKNIDAWRLEQSILETLKKRPDLIEALLNDQDVDKKLKKKVQDVKKKYLSETDV